LGMVMPDESNTTYIDEIIQSFQAKTATKNDRLFATAVVCYILDVNSSGIKIEKKSIVKLMDRLQVSFFFFFFFFFFFKCRDQGDWSCGGAQSMRLLPPTPRRYSGSPICNTKPQWRPQVPRPYREDNQLPIINVSGCSPLQVLFV
jgi:hypothetical protein